MDIKKYYGIKSSFQKDILKERKIAAVNIYQENGYESRRDYLESLSDEYAVPLDVVVTLADIMPGEEFDGLINALEDAEGMFEEE